jgi:polar amino acid transport system permease protein
LTAAGIYYLAMTTAFMGLQILIETALDPKKRQRMRRLSLTERMLGTSRALAVR